MLFGVGTLTHVKDLNGSFSTGCLHIAPEKNKATTSGEETATKADSFFVFRDVNLSAVEVEGRWMKKKEEAE